MGDEGDTTARDGRRVCQKCPCALGQVGEVLAARRPDGVAVGVPGRPLTRPFVREVCVPFTRPVASRPFLETIVERVGLFIMFGLNFRGPRARARL